MSFLAPLALISAAIVGPIIVAMYLLKLRREERVISSTFLWQRMVRDIEANAPWQKLRRNLLLLLQLLLMILLVLALARPFLPVTGISGSNLIIIFDRSASMLATDEPPTRLEAARRQAIALIDQLPDNGRATIITVGGQMEAPIASSNDRRELRRVIEQIQPSYSNQSDLTQALTLASALAAREPDSEVAIISDGNVTLPDGLRVPARVRYFPIGRATDNVAINAIALQPGPFEQTLFVQATNYGGRPVTRRLSIYLDGRLDFAIDLTIDPGREQSLTQSIPATVTIVEARLDENGDALPVDDRAFAVSPQRETVRVRLVSDGNRFLETALSLLPGIEVVKAPTTTTTFTESAAEIPLTIFDGVTPAELPPGNLLFIGPLQSTELFSITGEFDFPLIRPATLEDPLLRNVRLNDVNILRAPRIVPGTWARVIVDSDGGPLLLAGEREGRRIVVLAFDLHLSDLPLNIAFPLLLSNMIEYLLPVSGVQLTTGQPIVAPVDPSIEEVRIIRPDGRVVSSRDGQVQVQTNQTFYTNTDVPGVYTLEERRGNEVIASRRFAVNLFAPNESRIEPRRDLSIPQISGAQSTVVRERDGRQEIWRWLALVALIVLLIEWLYYQRNTLTMLRERWRRRTA
ncbi:BatA and WFA domain-containing protein [Chloroflexus sp.]|uniref:BatA and WFA domain-containing protein n=1 Tax=Chloroflexus sp. TaxID=1904827 RepID=UPI002ADE74E0|nr:BatA and WFA domain-containing protein [Chloroflexus sp.]